MSSFLSARAYGQGTHDVSSNSLFEQLAGQRKQKDLAWHQFEQAIELPRGMFSIRTILQKIYGQSGACAVGVYQALLPV